MKRRTFTKLILTLGAIGLAVATARAQNFQINWFTLDGGGGTSTGGAFAVSGTIGQPDANAQPMTNGNFSLTGGFWSIFAVQTPGAPLLSIERLVAEARIVWPMTAQTFQLQENTNLELPNSWMAVAQPAVTNGAQISVTVPASAARKFFRLKSP